MFTNYLPNEMVAFLEITTIFAVLLGTILVMLFTSDQANKKNLYLKKAKWINKIKSLEVLFYFLLISFNY